MKISRFGTAIAAFVFVFYGTFLFGQSQSRQIAIEPVNDSGGQKYAFLVGIDEYKHFNTLQYTVNDITAFRDRLLELGFPPSNIVILASNAQRMALRPTKENIETRFSEFTANLRRGDMVICMLSGHGTEVSGVPYFCPEEARKETADQLRESCVSISAMLQQLEGSSAKFKWMIVDACRNDPTRSASPAGVKSLSIDNIPKGVALFQSCATGQVSWEEDKFKHGAFSYFLLEGLGGAAVDKVGNITLYDICKYATSKTNSHALATYKKEQLPYLTGEMSDFVIREGKQSASSSQDESEPDDDIDKLKWMIEKEMLNCITVTTGETRWNQEKRKVALEIQVAVDYDKYKAFARSFTELLKQMGAKYSGVGTLKTSREMLDNASSRFQWSRKGEYDYNAKAITTRIKSPEALSGLTKHSIYIATDKWRAMPDSGGTKLEKFAWYTPSLELFEDVRNSLIAVKSKDIIIELSDNENKNIATFDKVLSYCPYYVDKKSNEIAILLFPALFKDGCGVSGLGGYHDIWPGTPDYKEEIYLDIPREDMNKIHNVKVRYEQDAGVRLQSGSRDDTPKPPGMMGSGMSGMTPMMPGMMTRPDEKRNGAVLEPGMTPMMPGMMTLPPMNRK